VYKQTEKENSADTLQGCEQAKENDLNFLLLTHLKDIVHILHSISTAFTDIPLKVL
jgi:hypothetical protein